MTTTQKTGKSRQERKTERNAKLATFESDHLARVEKRKVDEARKAVEHAQWVKDHPVSAGLIKVVNYTPPASNAR